MENKEYDDIVQQIEITAEEINKEYIPIFSKNMRTILKENKDKSKNEIRKKIYMSTMSTISMMAVEIAWKVEDLIGEEDEYTKGHVSNTSTIANKLAERLVENEEILAKYIQEKNNDEKFFKELDEKTINKYKSMFFYDVFAGSLLHDVGKLPISKKKYSEQDENGNTVYYSLITLPRKLTKEEFEIIKTHTDIGYDLLMKVAQEIEKTIDQKYKLNLRDSLDMIGKAILYHHERADGKGYHNLKNKDIPVVAKIIQTADIYDALVSKRPYKEAWDDKTAREEMRKNENKQCEKIYLDTLDEIINS